MLNRNDLIPLYAQLQQIIKNDIMSEKYKDAEQIPSESQFIQKYQITRTTIRKAISNLVNEGLLFKVHGKGTFVSLRKVKYNMLNFSGFTEFINKKNETPISKVLESEIISENGEEFFKLVRSRGVKKEDHILWLTLDTSITPLKIFPDINKYNFSKESLYNIMKQKYNIIPKVADLIMTGLIGNATTEKIFNHKKDTILIKAEGKVVDANGVVLEKVSVIYGPNMDFRIVNNI